MSVLVTTKTEVKLKKISFKDDILVDENGEVVDLFKEMKLAFGEKEFDLNASITSKEEYETNCLNEE